MYLEHQWEKYMLTSKRTILKEYSITHLKLIKRMFLFVNTGNKTWQQILKKLNLEIPVKHT